MTGVGLLKSLNALDDKALPRRPWRGTKAEAFGLITGGGAMAFATSERTTVALVALGVSILAFGYEMVQRRREAPSA